MRLPVSHCVKGTPGWELHPKITAALGSATVIDKPTFGSRELAEQLVQVARKEELDITLVGLCTDICVVSNALLIKAFLPETPIRVTAECCAGVAPESHRAALDTIWICWNGNNQSKKCHGFFHGIFDSPKAPVVFASVKWFNATTFRENQNFE